MCCAKRSCRSCSRSASPCWTRRTTMRRSSSAWRGSSSASDRAMPQCSMTRSSASPPSAKRCCVKSTPCAAPCCRRARTRSAASSSRAKAFGRSMPLARSRMPSERTTGCPDRLLRARPCRSMSRPPRRCTVRTRRSLRRTNRHCGRRRRRFRTCRRPNVSRRSSRSAPPSPHATSPIEAISGTHPVRAIPRRSTQCSRVHGPRSRR